MRKLQIISGIYKITNLMNRKFYIGSAKNVRKRWNTHRQQLNKNLHHNLHLQRAWNKYGKDNFLFETLEEDIFGENNLKIFEQKWINLLNPEYNIGSVGGGDNISKHPKNKEIREKHRINAKNKYKNLSDKDKKKLSRSGELNPNWRGGSSQKYCVCGKPMAYNAKTCKKCYDINSTNNPFYNRKHSEDTRRKISEANKGHKPTNSKKVIINDILYMSQSEASKTLGISPCTVANRIKKNYPGYKYLD